METLRNRAHPREASGASILPLTKSADGPLGPHSVQGRTSRFRATRQQDLPLPSMELLEALTSLQVTRQVATIAPRVHSVTWVAITSSSRKLASISLKEGPTVLRTS